MTEKLSGCPLCDCHEETLFLEGKDYFLTGEPFTIVECPSCSFRYTNPRPTFGDSGRYYQTDDYISHDSGNKGVIPLVYGFVRNWTLRSKYNLVRIHSAGTSILDIGCGTGEFLNFCQGKGLRCTGVEPSAKARNFAINTYGLEVKPDFLEDIDPSARFDCITLWHVLEHIHKLDETLGKLAGLLNQEGILVVALPNSNSWDAGYYGKFWAAYDLPRHIYHFTKDTLRALTGKYDFTCQKILPQKFDSYYISLLSEKYKHGSTNYLRAFIHGAISNRKAGNPQFGHSSEIYILKSKKS